MGGPISRRPTGLLDLLHTQQQGSNPDQLGEIVNPTIELFPFYGSQRIEGTDGSAAVTAVANQASIPIPAGETWMPLFFGVRGSFATVNQSLTIEFSIDTIPSINRQIIGSTGQMSAVGATDLFAGAVQFQNRLFYPPGTIFRLTVQEINLDAQPSITAIANISYIRADV